MYMLAKHNKSCLYTTISVDSSLIGNTVDAVKYRAELNLISYELLNIQTLTIINVILVNFALKLERALIWN